MNIQGFIWALIASVLWGSTPLIDKLGLSKVDPLSAVLIRNLVISVTVVPMLFIIGKGEHFLNVDKKSAMLIIIGGFLASLLGQWAYYKALKCCEASRVVPIAGTYPLIAFIMAVVVLGEPITIKKIIGVIFVVGGVILLGH